jgi:hypothetical protein
LPQEVIQSLILCASVALIGMAREVSLEPVFIRGR